MKIKSRGKVVDIKRFDVLPKDIADVIKNIKNEYDYEYCYNYTHNSLIKAIEGGYLIFARGMVINDNLAWDITEAKYSNQSWLLHDPKKYLQELLQSL